MIPVATTMSRIKATTIIPTVIEEELLAVVEIVVVGFVVVIVVVFAASLEFEVVAVSVVSVSEDSSLVVEFEFSPVESIVSSPLGIEVVDNCPLTVEVSTP